MTIRFTQESGRNTLINDYFPPSRFKSWPTFGGTMEPGHIENSYHLFEAGGRKWLVIGLEWGPRDKALDWAAGFSRNTPTARPSCSPMPISTATRPGTIGRPRGTASATTRTCYDIPGGANDGEEMWNKLIKKHPNVLLVMNGHIGGDGLGFQVSKADDGHRVNEMAVDYQRQEIGGGAWLRLLEFLPDGKTVQARTL